MGQRQGLILDPYPYKVCFQIIEKSIYDKHWAHTKGVRNRTPILEIRAEAEFRAVRTDHSAAPLHSFVARPFFYSVVAFLVFCLYSPLRCPEHLRQYRRLSFYCQELFASYSPFFILSPAA